MLDSSQLNALDIVDKEELASMSAEEQAEFYKQIGESKHAYINNALAETFKEVKKSAEFVETIEALVKKHITEIEGKRYVPNFQDVLYNLTVYSACVLERLAYGEPYRTHWVDPALFTPNIGCTYLVMLSCGFIAEATVDTMDVNNLQIVLADSTTRIHKNRLLAINTFISDADEFMRGAPRIAYDALGRIEAGVVPSNDELPTLNILQKNSIVSRDTRLRNRNKRLRKKKK